MTSAAAQRAPLAVVRARDLRRHLRQVRRTSGAARPIGETLQDLYVAVFAVVVVSVMCAPLARTALQDVASRPHPGRGAALLAPALGLALALAATGTALRALVLVGPVVQDPGRATWVLTAPISRATLLAPAAGLLVAAGAAGGLLVALAAGVLTGWPTGWAALSGALTGVLVTAAGVAAQAARRPVRRRVLRGAGDVVALAAAPVLLLGISGGRLVSARSVPSAGWLAPAATVALLIVTLAVLSRGPAALRRLRRSDLVAGAGLATGLRATVTSLDGSFVAETLRVRRLLERARVRPRRLFGRGPSALVVADLRRVSRSPLGLVATLVATPLVAAAGDLYGRAAAAALLMVLAWAAAASTASGLRSVTRSPALARSLPFPDATLRMAHIAVPAVAAALVAGIGSTLAGRPGWWVEIAVLVAVAGVLRTAAGRPPVRWEMQATSPMGALPVGAMTSYLIGLDVVAISSLPFVLGASFLGSALLPALAVVILLHRRPKRSA